jgi:hypothetical protein
LARRRRFEGVVGILAFRLRGPIEQEVDLGCVETRQLDLEVETRQFDQRLAQRIFVKGGLVRELVVGDRQRLLLRRGQVT